MARVKRGTTKNTHRKNTLKLTKGYRGNLRKKERQANEAIAHAGNNAFNDRRKKKGDFRRLWTVKLNAAVRQHGLSYSKFIDALKKKEIALDRKVLADMAENNPEAFARIVKTVA